MADAEDRNQLLAEFTGVTGTDPERAQFYLESSGWELHVALSSFFDSQGDDLATVHQPFTGTQENQDGNTSGLPTRSARSTGGRFTTISSIKPTDDSNSSEDEGQAFYAGGSDRSGQQILGPPRKKQTASNITQELFEEAKKHGAEEVQLSSESQKQRAPAFVGAGYRLGDTEGGTSLPVQVQREPRNASMEPVNVKLKFWSNGFSIDDGPLRSFEDPANEEFLNSVRRGEIPRELQRHSRGGEVHVDMEDHRDEEYVKPKPVVKAFSGEGRKLGSPTPAVHVSDNKPEVDSALPASSSMSGTGSGFKVDPSQPTTSIQIRLGDGTRMVSKFNHTHTIGDIRNFICAARREMAGANFSLLTTFPNKELTDEKQTLADANLLNAVIVQRFK